MIGELFKAMAEEVFDKPENRKDSGLVYSFAKAHAGLHMMSSAAAAITAGPPAPSMAFDF